MHLVPSIYQGLTVSWWNDVAPGPKTAIFDSLTHFFTPYAVIVVGLDTIPEVPDQAISLI